MNKIGPNLRKLAGDFIKGIPDSWDTAQQIEDYLEAKDIKLSDDAMGLVIEFVDMFLIDSGKAIEAAAQKELDDKKPIEKIIDDLVTTVLLYSKDERTEKNIKNVVLRAKRDLGV